MHSSEGKAHPEASCAGNEASLHHLAVVALRTLQLVVLLKACAQAGVSSAAGKADCDAGQQLNSPGTGCIQLTARCFGRQGLRV